MKALIALLLASTAAAEPPVFTPGCDHDGWTCYDGFPAIDRMTIANVVNRNNGIVLELVSVATGKVLRRELVFDAGTVQRSAQFNRELRRFRPMKAVEIQTESGGRYRTGTVELTIHYCEDTDCRTTYRVRRLRR